MPAGAPNWPAAIAQRGLNVSLKAYQLVRSEQFPVMFPSGLRAARWPLLLLSIPHSVIFPTHCIPSVKGVFSLSGLKRPKQMVVRGWHQRRGPRMSKNTSLAFSEAVFIHFGAPQPTWPGAWSQVLGTDELHHPAELSQSQPSGGLLFFLFLFGSLHSSRSVALLFSSHAFSF